MRRLTRLLIIAVTAGAIWTLIRALLDRQAESQSAETRKPSATGERNGASDNGGASATKAELYREAQRLGVEGRSKMTKDELAASISAARQV